MRDSLDFARLRTKIEDEWSLPIGTYYLLEKYIGYTCIVLIALGFVVSYLATREFWIALFIGMFFTWMGIFYRKALAKTIIDLLLNNHSNLRIANVLNIPVNHISAFWIREFFKFVLAIPVGLSIGYLAYDKDKPGEVLAFLIITLLIVFLTVRFLYESPYEKGKYKFLTNEFGLIRKFIPQSLWVLHLYSDIQMQFQGIEYGLSLYEKLLDKAEKRYYPQFAAKVMNELGWYLALFHEFEDSLLYLELSIRAIPDNGKFYESLGIYYLELGQHPKRALECLNMAMSLIPPKSSTYTLTLAAYARTLAMVNDYGNARLYLGQAYGVSNPYHLPYRAGLYWHEGHIERLIGSKSKAKEQFQKAIETDPNGLYAKLAKRDLALL